MPSARYNDEFAENVAGCLTSKYGVRPEDFRHKSYPAHDVLVAIVQQPESGRLSIGVRVNKDSGNVTAMGYYESTFGQPDARRLANAIWHSDINLRCGEIHFGEGGIQASCDGDAYLPSLACDDVAAAAAKAGTAARRNFERLKRIMRKFDAEVTARQFAEFRAGMRRPHPSQPK